MTDGVLSPDEIQQMLSLLDPRERAILKFRFALGGSGMHTLDETAEHFDVTRAQVRTAETEAMAKLHRPHPR